MKKLRQALSACRKSHILLRALGKPPYKSVLAFLLVSFCLYYGIEIAVSVPDICTLGDRFESAVMFQQEMILRYACTIFMLRQHQCIYRLCSLPNWNFRFSLRCSKKMLQSWSYCFLWIHEELFQCCEFLSSFLHALLWPHYPDEKRVCNRILHILEWSHLQG